MIAAILALAAVLLVRSIPLVNPMLSAMTSGRPGGRAVLLGDLASVTALALSAVSVGSLMHRRA
jgi:hypothetical protein